MRYLLRRHGGTVHQAVLEGGGGMLLMMTACGLSIRWDQPHAPWERARWMPGYDSHVTCRKCNPNQKENK